jgi:hypothetical protein
MLRGEVLGRADVRGVDDRHLRVIKLDGDDCDGVTPAA